MVKASEAGFLNEPVYPTEIPVSGQAGFKWVFAREVALHVLGEHLHGDPKSMGFHKMTNEQLSEQLVNTGVMYPEFLGGVVDDGQPNGLMPNP